MPAAFIAKLRPDPGAFYTEYNLTEPALVGHTEIELLNLPSPALGIFDIHIIKVACKKRRLLAASARPNFNNNRANRHIISHNKSIFNLIEKLLALCFETVFLLGRQ